MPWEERGVVEQRMQFFADYESGEWTMSELSEYHSISRKTGYKLLRRVELEGVEGLKNQSRAAHRHRNQIAAGVQKQILELKQAHMSWGARKLRGWLVNHRPEQVWPAASTIGEILKREGLVKGRRRRYRTPAYTQPFAEAGQANDVWCVDFKGWFLTGDGERIDPFTMTDAYSRYLLRCQAVDKTDTATVRAISEAAFREYGLPRAIRSDNGAPFASRAVAGISRLSLYWMKLGIVVERIERGHPEQNGRHERMHRTLGEETASPPGKNKREQQWRFGQFRQDYNEVRPHEALGQKPPSAFYRASPRSYPSRIGEPEYDSDWLVRSLWPHGQFDWKHNCIFLSKVLAGERIGLQQLGEDYWCIYFASFPIPYFDSAKLRLCPLVPQHKLSQE